MRRIVAPKKCPREGFEMLTTKACIRKALRSPTPDPRASSFKRGGVSSRVVILWGQKAVVARVSGVSDMSSRYVLFRSCTVTLFPMNFDCTGSEHVRTRVFG